MSAQSHQSDPRVLNRRTLEQDHRSLAAQLRVGMTVLDVGCGTGSITAGIAQKVGLPGSVVGIDRDESLLAIARKEYEAIPNLRFAREDVVTIDWQNEFDIATAARVLQWIPEPGQALDRMKRIVRNGGRIVVLDYSHSENSWEPQPPKTFLKFNEAFLAWRTSHAWSNHIGSELPELFRKAGLEVIQISNEDEHCVRGELDFEGRASIWADVLQSLGPTMVADGFLSESARETAELDYRSWLTHGLIRQTLCLRAVVGAVRR